MAADSVAAPPDPKGLPLPVLGWPNQPPSLSAKRASAAAGTGTADGRSDTCRSDTGPRIRIMHDRPRPKHDRPRPKHTPQHNKPQHTAHNTKSSQLDQGGGGGGSGGGSSTPPGQLQLLCRFQATFPLMPRQPSRHPPAPSKLHHVSYCTCCVLLCVSGVGCWPLVVV